MKRILSLLILFTGILFLYDPSHSQDLPYTSKYWTALSLSQKAAYLEGFSAGSALAFFDCFDNESIINNPKAMALLRKYNLSDYDQEVLAQVMTQIYSDPANSYIGIPTMVFIARDKLFGKNVESDLIEHRKKAYELKELLKKYKKTNP